MPLTLKTDYGRVVVAKLRKELKTRVLFNENYRGNAAAGAVMIPLTPESSLIDYNKGSIGSNSVSYAENSYINCVIEQDKALSKYIDGYQANALPYDVVIDELEKAGYAFAKAEDTHAINTLVYAINGKGKGGSNAFASTDPRYQKTGTVVSLGQADIYEKIVEIFGAQTDKGVNTERRWMLVNGAGFGKVLASNKAIRQSDLSQEIVMRGAMAMIGGYEVYVSGNLTGTQSVTTGTGNDAVTTSNDIYAIFGHADFCTRVEAFVQEPFFIDGNYDANVVGGSFVKGRFVFTHECLNPEAFWLLCA